MSNVILGSVFHYISNVFSGKRGDSGNPLSGGADKLSSNSIKISKSLSHTHKLETRIRMELIEQGTLFQMKQMSYSQVGATIQFLMFFLIFKEMKTFMIPRNPKSKTKINLLFWLWPKMIVPESKFQHKMVKSTVPLFCITRYILLK